MADFDRKTCILILTFWIFVPTMDMVSDMTMVIRLFRGPNPDQVVSGGEFMLLDIPSSFIYVPSVLDFQSCSF